MKKKLINIQDITVVMNRASRGLTIEGVMFIDEHTHQLTFKPYNLAKYQPGYYKRTKPKLIKKLPWGALKQSIRNNILRLSVPQALGTAQTIAIFNNHVSQANDALIDLELKEFC